MCPVAEKRIARVLSRKNLNDEEIIIDGSSARCKNRCPGKDGIGQVDLSLIGWCEKYGRLRVSDHERGETGHTAQDHTGIGGPYIDGNGIVSFRERPGLQHLVAQRPFNITENLFFAAFKSDLIEKRGEYIKTGIIRYDSRALIYDLLAVFGQAQCKIDIYRCGATHVIQLNLVNAGSEISFQFTHKG